MLGTWRSHPCPTRDSELWDEFCHDMNQWHGLEWDCEAPSTTIDFMDLTISIIGNCVETTLFEKPQNLYLYLPADSSHPPGQGTDLVLGQVLCFRRLCSKVDDADEKVRDFHSRLCARGHSPTALQVLFDRAEENAATYMTRTPAEHEARRLAKKEESHRQVRFHLEFHPQDPPSREIQHLWRSEIAHPYNETPLRELENCEHVPMGFDRLIVAYSRPLNLRNLFSVRDISEKGSAVSTYLAE